MNGLPYYKAYPRDFLEGTIGMDFEVKCAYRVVLDMIYMQGGELPDDARYISGLLGCSIRKWNSIREKLIQMGKIHTSGEFIVNYRADKELESLSKLQEKQSENRSRPNKNNDLPTPRVNHTEPEPEPDIKKEPKGSTKKRRKPLCELPESWVPNDTNIQHAANKGFTQTEIDHEANQFSNYHHSKQNQYRDWDAAWRTWIGNAAKRRGGGTLFGQQATFGHQQGGSIASIAARRRSEGSV